MLLPPLDLQLIKMIIFSFYPGCIWRRIRVHERDNYKSVCGRWGHQKGTAVRTCGSIRVIVSSLGLIRVTWFAVTEGCIVQFNKLPIRNNYIKIYFSLHCGYKNEDQNVLEYCSWNSWSACSRIELKSRTTRCINLPELGCSGSRSISACYCNLFDWSKGDEFVITLKILRYFSATFNILHSSN